MPRPWRSGTIATSGSPPPASVGEPVELLRRDLRDVDRQDEDRPCAPAAIASSRASRSPSLSPPLRWRSGRAPARRASSRTSSSGCHDERLVDPGRGHGGADRRVGETQREVAPLLGVEDRAEPRLRALDRPDRDDRDDPRRRHRGVTGRGRREVATTASAKPRPRRVVGHDRVGDERLDSRARDLRLQRGIDAIQHEMADQRSRAGARRRARSTPRRAMPASGRPGPSAPSRRRSR